MSSAEPTEEHGAEHHAAAEPDKPNNGLITGLVFIIIASIVATCVGIGQFWELTLRREISSKVLEQGGEELRAQRATEADKLSRYQWVNKADRVVRIPIDRARELTLADWSGRAPGLVPIGGVDTSAPAISATATAPSVAPSTSTSASGSASAAASTSAVPATSAAPPPTSASVAPHASVAPSASAVK